MGLGRHGANGRAMSIVHGRDGHGHIRVYLDLLAFICVNLACFDARRTIAAVRGAARHKPERDDGPLCATSLVAANGCAAQSVLKYLVA
jgi:hypothetical protein